MSQNEQEPTRKPYTRPTLTVYGDVRKITENVGAHGIGDVGGFGMHSKTSP